MVKHIPIIVILHMIALNINLVLYLHRMGCHIFITFCAFFVICH